MFAARRPEEASAGRARWLAGRRRRVLEEKSSLMAIRARHIAGEAEAFMLLMGRPS